MKNLFSAVKYRYGVLLLSQLLLLSANKVFAQSVIPVPTYSTPDQLIDNVICEVAFWMWYILMALVILLVLVAAYKYMTSSGDPTKVSEATKMLTYAVVGLVVALLAKSVPLIVLNIFGANSAAVALCP